MRIRTTTRLLELAALGIGLALAGSARAQAPSGSSDSYLKPAPYSTISGKFFDRSEWNPQAPSPRRSYFADPKAGLHQNQYVPPALSSSSYGGRGGGMGGMGGGGMGRGFRMPSFSIAPLLHR